MDEAHLLFWEGLSIAEEMGDQYFIAAFLYNLADTALRKQQFEKASQFLKRSMSISDQMKIVFMQAWSLMLLTRVNLAFGRIPDAAQAMRKAILLSENLSDADLNRLMLWVMVMLCASFAKL